MRTARIATSMGWLILALPITCSQTSGDLYTGGIQPSPGGRINPAEPYLVNGGDSNGGGPR